MYQNLFRRVSASRILPTVIFVAGMFAASYHILLFGAAIVAALLCILLLPPKLNYTFTDSQQARWEELQSAWNAVFASQKLIQIVPRAQGGNPGEAGSPVDYFPAAPKRIFPLPIRMNITPPVLKLKDGYLSIMPDSVFFVRDWNAVAQGYGDVQIRIDAIGYLETDKVAEDTEIIGHRWLFANPDGTPDASHGDNVELPLVKYGRILIEGKNGVSAQLICSNEKAAAALADLLGSQTAV